MLKIRLLHTSKSADNPLFFCIFGPVRFLLPVCRFSWFLYTLNIYAHFSSHFSQQLLMAEIWYLFIRFRFLLPVCRFCWFLYTFNIHLYMHIFRRIHLIFGHKLHIGTPYRGKHFWTHQIPISSLLTLLIFIHIEHTFCICPF